MEKFPESNEYKKSLEELLRSEKDALAGYEGIRKKKKIGAVLLLASVLAIGGCNFGAQEHQRGGESGKNEKEVVLIHNAVPMEKHEQAKRIARVADWQEENALVVERETKHAVQASERREVIVEHRNAEHLTASSTWIDPMVEKAEHDESELQSREDAEWFIKSTINELTQEFYFPTQGVFDARLADKDLDSIGAPKVRKYTPDDGEHIREQVQKIVGIVKNVDKKFGTDFYKDYSEQIKDVLAKAQEESSYAHNKQIDALRNAEKVLDEK
ncbi:MAG: hypothetical protein ACYDFU_01865 [Nitrospirota bacterium]